MALIGKPLDFAGILALDPSFSLSFFDATKRRTGTQVDALVRNPTEHQTWKMYADTGIYVYSNLLPYCNFGEENNYIQYVLENLRSRQKIVLKFNVIKMVSNRLTTSR